MNMASAINVWETSKNTLSVMLSLACCTDRACMFVIVGPCLTSMFPYMLPTDMICWVKFGFWVVKKSVTICDFCKLLSTECALPAMPLSLQQQSLPGERYLMIAVERPRKQIHIAMLIKGVFTFDECEAWLSAFPFDVMTPAQAETPDLHAYFENHETVIWQTTCASSACGTIEASWWSPFKQAFYYEFDNLKLADEYTWEIWNHFLNHDAGNADKKFADVPSLSRVVGDNWYLELSRR